MDRERAVTILRAISGYRLSEGRWARVDRALRALDEAASSGDQRAAALAVRDLDLIGPVRLRNRHGDPPRRPIPEETRERLNRLVVEFEEREPAEDG
ncbi:CATRA system-associated protein [Nonomuraea roseola]|uniref:CATRA system-associated protein n=1 Tax=Nonomuraea roseola TaxID=46179 RepID=A0ABV5Q8E3_9ACTN